MAPKELVLIGEVPRTALGKVVRSALASDHAPSSD
jgi:acyl-coenzyme A synthetase/AMP-(fatty) acid ligase